MPSFLYIVLSDLKMQALSKTRTAALGKIRPFKVIWFQGYLLKYSVIMMKPSESWRFGDTCC